MLSITSAGCKQLWTTRFGSQNWQPPSLQVQGRRSGHKGTAVGHRRRWPLSACNRCLTIYTTASLAIYMTGRSCPGTMLQDSSQICLHKANQLWVSRPPPMELFSVSFLSIFGSLLLLLVCRWQWSICLWLEQEWSAWSPSVWRCDSPSSTSWRAATLCHKNCKSFMWMEPHPGYWKWWEPNCVGIQCFWTTGSSRHIETNW